MYLLFSPVLFENQYLTLLFLKCTLALKLSCPFPQTENFDSSGEKYVNAKFSIFLIHSNLAFKSERLESALIKRPVKM